MKCLAICHDELVVRMLDDILLPSFEIEFLVENRALARRDPDLDALRDDEAFLAALESTRSAGTRPGSTR